MTDAIELQVESLDHEGRGIARRDGKVVFVSGALPGEAVRAQVTGRKPKFDRARAVEIVSQSSQRVSPECPHFGLHAGACGGCSMQHLTPAAQVAIKGRVLEDALWHVGRVRAEMILPPLVGPSWGYRHRARLTVRYVAKKGGVLVGFHERASSYVADMRECHVLPPAVSAVLLPLRDLIGTLSIRERLPQIELAVDRQRIVMVLRVLESPTQADRGLLLDFGHRHRIEFWLQPAGPASAAPIDAGQAHSLSLDLPEFGVCIPFGPTDFTQVNHSINEVLVGRAIRLLDVGSGDRVVDFFCGLGNFTLPLATRAQQVLGIEGAAELVERARTGARVNRLTERCSFEARNLFDWTADDWANTVETLGGVDGVLIDPPRDGATAVVAALAAAGAAVPRRLVYVSCNPATLARDCSTLVHQAGWQLRAAGVVNMFAHTSHVESIALLQPPPTRFEA